MNAYRQIKNDKIEKHLNETVVVKSRQTGHVRERLVADLLREAEGQDAWYEITDRTIAALDSFLTDYQIEW